MYRLLFLLLGLLFPTSAFAEETEIGEVADFGEYISQIWAWSTQVIFGISAIMLIIGGILYMAARGEEEKIDTAKQVVSGALVSTVLMLFSGVLFAFLQKPTSDISGPAKLTDATFVLENISNLLLGIVGGASVIMLIYNGIQYMLASGDLEKLERAKSGLKFSIIGLSISFLAYGIINWVITIWL
ncbi:hypothetical protein HZA38_04825 [Candidatus Peregrinibacteria bacterium]|nr:hypothetical protein [Candidatus Peregrinibacteria bacterium]